MSEQIDDLYLTWLYSQVASVKLKNPAKTTWSLIRQLYTKEFIWLIPNDDNRVEDGRDLRHDFVNECDIENPDPAWLDLGCSMLEMLIALSRRLAFEAEGEARDWFWTLLHNAGIWISSDIDYDDEYAAMVDEKLETIIWRRYDPSGQGGLFPLQYEYGDQREVELWYQLSAYVLERF